MRRSPEKRARPVQTRASARRTRNSMRNRPFAEEELDDKRRRATRRKFLIGAIAIGGAGVAAYELLPRGLKLLAMARPHRTTLERHLRMELAREQKMPKGIAQSSGRHRRLLTRSWHRSSQTARVAYDVFVNPLVTLAADVAGEFLNVTLQALIEGRKALVGLNEDSPTLLTPTVLKTWVDQANEMP